MAWRRFLLSAVASALACAALLAPLPAQAAMWPVPGAGGAYRAVPPEPYLNGRFISTAQLSAQLASCEERMERTEQVSRQKVPTVVIVGASFTAGVGPGSLDGSWAALLARHLGWNAVVYGDPGAGYVRPGIHRRGPVSREISEVDLRDLNPALVIVQAGHNDMGVPADVEQVRVKQALAQIRAAVPAASIALITVFAGRLHRPAAYQTDRTIIAAARAADPAVIIMDPLAVPHPWKFARVRDGLHPTAAGSRWIAGQVSQILGGHGVQPLLAPRGAGVTPGARPKNMICDFGLQVPPAVRALPITQVPSALR